MLLFFCNITLHLAAEAMLLHSKIQCVCFWLILFRNTDKGRVQAHTSLQPCEMSICSLIFNRGSSLNRGTVLCFTARACSGVLKHPVFFLLQIFYFFFEYQQLNAVTSSNIHLTWKVLNEAFWIWFKEKKKRMWLMGFETLSTDLRIKKENFFRVPSNSHMTASLEASLRVLRSLIWLLLPGVCPRI